MSIDNLKALYLRKGWKTGRTGCFEKGSVPPNKGKKMPYNAASARTQFKKGQMPFNLKPVGHERQGKDGYIEIRVAEPIQHKCGQRVYYRQKHRYLWEQRNGPVPDGHVLKSIDGDRTNCDPDNWMAIPQAMLPRLSGRWSIGYDDAPAELKPYLLAVARLEQAARERRKGAAG